MKQTAVEWLIEQLTPSISLQQKHIDELKKKAKEMEKQQIIDAVYYTCSSMTHYDLPCGEQYYNETFNK
jgi:hypothetical protein